MPADLPDTSILFFEGFDDLDAVGPLEILTAAGFPVRSVRVAGTAPGIRSAHGLRLEVEHELEAAPGLLVLPGGGWLADSPTGVRSQLRELVQSRLPAQLADWERSGTVLAAVCTGAMLLSAAGVLRGRPAVTNRLALDALAAGGAEVHPEARVVDAGTVLSAGGPAAGLDLGVHLVSRFAESEAGQRAADRLEHEPVGPVLMGSD